MGSSGGGTAPHSSCLLAHLGLDPDAVRNITTTPASSRPSAHSTAAQFPKASDPLSLVSSVASMVQRRVVGGRGAGGEAPHTPQPEFLPVGQAYRWAPPVV